MQKIQSVEHVIELLENAVKDRGADWVYPLEWKHRDGPCRYFIDGKPGCIIGHVIYQLGGGPDDVEEGEGVFGLEVWNRVLEISDDYKILEILEILSTAQTAQDYGTSWGEAVAAAYA